MGKMEMHLKGTTKKSEEMLAITLLKIQFENEIDAIYQEIKMTRTSLLIVSLTFVVYMFLDALETLGG